MCLLVTKLGSFGEPGGKMMGLGDRGIGLS